MAAGLAVAYGALAALAALALPRGRLAAWIEPRLESALGVGVELRGARLRLWPPIAVRLEGLAVANPPGFSERPLLRLEVLELRPRLLPLLARRVVVDEVRVVRPRLLLESNREAAWNVAALGRRPEEGAAPEASEPPVAFAVQAFRWQDGVVLVDDAATGRAFRVGDLDAHLSLRGDPASGRFAAVVAATLAQLEARVPAWSDTIVAFPALELLVDAAVDLGANAADLRQVALRWAGLALEGAGRATGLRGATREVALDLRATGADVGALLRAWVPRGAWRDVRATGGFDLEIRLEGPLGAAGLPRARGRLALRDIGLATRSAPNLVEGLTGTVELDGQDVAAPEIRARVFGRPQRVTLSARGWLDPALDLRWTGELALDDWSRSGGAAAGAKAAGILAGDLRVTGPPRRPDELRVTGRLALRDVTWQGATPAVPVRVPQAALEFTGRGVRTDRLPLLLGRSDLALSFELRDWTAAFPSGRTGARRAQLTFDARSRRLDWTELFPDRPDEVTYTELLWARLANRRLDGESVDEIAERQRFALTAAPPLDARGRAAIDTFLNENLRATDVALALTLENGVLRLDDLRARIFGGRVAGGLAVDLRRGPPFDATWSFVGESLQAAAFFDRFTHLGNAVAGTLAFELTGGGALDRFLLPVPERLESRARHALTDGALRDWGPTTALASFLRNERLKEIRVRRWVGTLEIVGSRVRFDDWNVGGERLAATVAGGFGFDGRLDAALRLQLDSTLARELGGPAAAALVRRGDGAWLALRMTGPARAPALSLDTDALRRLAADVVEERVGAQRAQVREEAERRLQEEVRGRLRRLLGGGRDTARADTARRDTAAPPPGPPDPRGP